MIREGKRAPLFELPGVIEGRPGRASLDSFLGESVVVLAFYPADFNPSCTDESTDLDEFDIFRMQSDATVLAISGDSLFSHRAFARTHNLRLPLLADTDSEVARAYGVESDNGRYPNHRAVVVIDNDGRVSYTWLAESIEERPSIEEVQAAFRAIGDADLAETQYRHGCEHYADGRDSFVAGIGSYEQRDWVFARGEFETALTRLETAGDTFRRAIRFSETDAATASYERAEHIVQEFRRAVGLFSDAASAHAGNNGSAAKQLREEARTALSDLRELGTPLDPDEHPADAGEALPSLDTESDIAADEESPVTVSDSPPTEPDAGAGQTTGSGVISSDGSATEQSTDQSEEVDDNKQSEEVDDNKQSEEEDLEALTAEIETQDASRSESSE